MKALPLAYNRDMQEDKEPMFDSYETYSQSLIMMSQMIKTMEVKRQNKIKSDHILATDLADEFVKKGVPFRTSHEMVGSIIKLSEETGKTYLELQKEVLGDIKNRLARAEATWDMAENIFQQLADQVRRHEYDIKDLNR